MVKVSVSFEFATAEEAISAIAHMRNIPKSDAPKPEVKPEKESGKSVGAKAEKTAPAPAPAPSATAAPAAAPSTQPSASTSQVGYAVVAEKITAAVKTHRAEVVALLTKFGAKNGKELKEGDYAAFVEQLDEKTTASELT